MWNERFESAIKKSGETKLNRLVATSLILLSFSGCTSQNATNCLEKNYANSCKLAGHEQFNKNNLDKALEFYKLGCTLGSDSSCDSAFKVLDNQGKSEDGEKLFLEQYSNNAEYLIGHFYEEYTNGNKDKIINFYKQGCEKKQAKACNRLGYIYYSFNSKNNDLAVSYWEQACTYGECFKINEIKQSKKEEERKIQEEKNRQENIKNLRARQGQHIMNFVDSISYKSYNSYNSFGRYIYTTTEEESQKICENLCNEKTPPMENNGYYTLQEALSSGWTFVSKISNTDNQINEHCVCHNGSYLLKK